MATRDLDPSQYSEADRREVNTRALVSEQPIIDGMLDEAGPDAMAEAVFV
jgi:hypothetical protein